MLDIGKPIQVNPPDRSISWDRREFPSPNKLWLAVFHKPYEWRMGAVAWEFSLEAAKDIASSILPKIDELQEDTMLDSPIDQVPWRDDSLMLSLLKWTEGLFLFDITTMQKQFIALEESPMNTQWAPHGSVLLVRVPKGMVILNGSGRILSIIERKSAELEHPYTGWLPSGKVFMAIGRKSRRSKPRISFYSASDGSTISEKILDPDVLVAYEANKYKKVPRGRNSLIISASTMSVGSLLDRWNQVFYDKSKELLYLSVYRPVGEMSKKKDYPVCEVSEKWIAISLSG